MRIAEGRAEIDDVGAFLDRLDGIAAEHDCTVQAFDADLIAGRGHLEAAVAHARRSFERGENVARDRGVEIMLYAAGRRQIDRALELGVREGENRLVVVVDDAGESEAGGESAEREDDAAAAVGDLLTPADTLGVEHVDEERLVDFFGITAAERRATDADLPDLVRERVALLDVEK